MSKSVTEWLQEGDQLFSIGLEEYRALEEQIVELEQRRAEKWTELEEIAKRLGRKPPESPHANAARNGSRPVAVATTLGGKR